MTTCPRCGMELFGYNDACPGCGCALRRRATTATLDPPTAPATTSSSPRPTAPVRQRSAMVLLRDFFAFRTMIGPSVLRCAYVIVAIAGSIWIATLILFNTVLLAMLSPSLAVTLHIPATIIAVAIYNICWRITCEQIMLRYDNNERLAKLTEKGREGHGGNR